MERSLWEIKPIREYMERIGADPEKLTECVVNKKGEGRYNVRKCVIRFSLDGNVICTDERYAPTEEEKRDIADVILNKGIGQYLALISHWPLDEITKLPPGLTENDDLFYFRNEKGQVIMIRHKIVKDNEKFYIPYTYWSDNWWRRCEPDGKFPLYNLEYLGTKEKVFLHEGEKAAKRMNYIMNHVDNLWKHHPWGEYLQYSTHLGWCTGANTPERTDWSPINRSKVVKEVYIVSDNDEPGFRAVPKIARALHHPTFLVQFTEQFPKKFDLGDDFPDNFYKKRGSKNFYIGPSYPECLEVATWATNVIKKENSAGKERIAYSVRPSFKSMWAYVEEMNAFVCRPFPWIQRDKEVLSNILKKYSDCKGIVDLVLKEQEHTIKKIAYRPDINRLRIVDGTVSAINAHCPPLIKAIDGDYTPFLEFMEYLVPKEKERYEVMKWCATLIAKPEVKMMYALLLISVKQGTGKTTLGQEILCPLVGHLNTSFPGERDITSDFNEWVSFKRLAIIGEIYTGHSWKPYNTLKSLITDRTITVNQKYIRQFKIDNWCHIYACSNSLKALKISNEDRRWLIPEITEYEWPKEKFIKFYDWFESGGLNYIKHWADTFPEYIRPGEIAPMTKRKLEMVESSKSSAQEEVHKIASIARDIEEPVAIFSWDLKHYLRSEAKMKVFETPKELISECESAGLGKYHTRIWFEKVAQYVGYNKYAWDIIKPLHEIERSAKLREFRRFPIDLLKTLNPVKSTDYQPPEDLYNDN